VILRVLIASLAGLAPRGSRFESRCLPHSFATSLTAKSPLLTDAARSLVQTAASAIRLIAPLGSHESMKISLISWEAQPSRSVSFNGSCAAVELAGRGTSSEPTASLTTLPG
jgi:hypothetical protein